MRKLFKVLLVLVALAALVLVFLFPHGRKYRVALAEYKGGLVERGEKLKLADFAPPHATNLLAGRLEQVRLVRIANPPAVMRLVAPGVVMAGHKNLTPAMLASYDANTNRTAEFRALFDGRTAADFQFDYSKESSEFFVQSALVLAENAFYATGTVAFGKKDAAESEADLKAAIDLARLYQDAPVSDYGADRSSMMRYAIAVTWEALQSDAPDLPWREIQTNWEASDSPGGLEGGLKLGRAYMLDEFVIRRRGVSPGAAIEEIVRAPSPPGTNRVSFFSHLGQMMKAGWQSGPAYWRWRSSWAYDEELYGLQMVDLSLAVNGRAEVSDAFVPAFAEFARQSAQINEAHADAADHYLILPAPSETLTFSNALVRHAITETERRMVIVAIALKRYQQAHDSYPTNLSQLVPEFVSTVPRDFMDGQPLRYQLQADGNYLLYSAGLDGKDDGGDPVYGGTGGSNDWTRGRDMVWPRAATQKEAEDFLNGQKQK